MRRLIIFRLVAVLAFFATLSPAMAPAQGADITIGPNDTVRVRVYEWKPSEALLLEWPSFSGEFEISAAGRLFMPLIGEVEAEGKVPSELAADIELALKDKAGLITPPTATVEITRYRPIYTMGNINQPGTYDFRPGMTVLQAVSIAGGLLRPQDENAWSATRDAIQANGEVQRLDAALKLLAARRARLEAEFAGAEEIVFPLELTETDKVQLAAKVMQQETEILVARKRALEAQTEALEDHKGLLEQEIESLLEQIAIKDEELASLEQEAENVASLVDQGLASQPRQLSVLRELSGIKAEKVEIKTLVLRAQQDLAKADLQILELRDRQATDVTTELQETLADIAELSSKKETAREIVISATEAAGTIASIEALEALYLPIYTVVHQDGTQEVAAENTALKPGDLVKVELGAMPETRLDITY